LRQQRRRPTAVYPGDIIPEQRAKSSRNTERHQIGLVGDIIPDSRATSLGISRGQGVRREAGSERLEENHRVVINGSNPDR